MKLDAMWQALVEEFKVVEIVLEDGDGAQVIFETLNERGELFSQQTLSGIIYSIVPTQLVRKQRVFSPPTGNRLKMLFGVLRKSKDAIKSSVLSFFFQIS